MSKRKWNNEDVHSLQNDDNNMNPSCQWTVNLATTGDEVPLVVSRDISVADLLQTISDKTNISVDGLQVLCMGCLLQASDLKAYEVLGDKMTVQITGEPQVTDNILTLWLEVEGQLQKENTIVWKKSLDSLEAAKEYFLKDGQARRFVDKNLLQIIEIMIAQSPKKVGPHERQCIYGSLAIAAEIISLDLQSHGSLGSDTHDCTTVNCLGALFVHSRAAVKNDICAKYQEAATYRAQILSSFKRHGGFTSLATYMAGKVGLDSFPDERTVVGVIERLNDEAPNFGSLEDKAAAVVIVKSSIDHVSLCVPDSMGGARKLFKAFAKAATNEAITTDWEETDLWDLWSSLVLRMIDIRMPIDIRQKGWWTCYNLMEWSIKRWTEPETVTVKGAGLLGVDGVYTHCSVDLPDSEGDSSWARIVPDGFGNLSGTTLTLFRCKLRSGNKWWFISKIDKEQPGTDRDIDLYLCKTQSDSPPLEGWIASKTGLPSTHIPISPTVEISPLMDATGEDAKRFFPHRFFCWAQENSILAKIKSDAAHQNLVSADKHYVCLHILKSMLEFGRSESAQNCGVYGQETIEELYQEITAVTSAIDKAVPKFDPTAPEEERKSAIEALHTIIQNILTMSEDEDHKAVENCVLQQQVAGRPGGHELMTAAGFHGTQVGDGEVMYEYGGSHIALLSAKVAVLTCIEYPSVVI